MLSVAENELAYRKTIQKQKSTKYAKRCKSWHCSWLVGQPYFQDINIQGARVKNTI